MANAIELALMAGRIYQSTRDKINWLPDLLSLGWTEFFHVPNASIPTTSGFEAISFQKGNEIVISFAGTGTGVDWLANLANGIGLTSDQLRQAADYYLKVKAANPGAAISFTGHSLGGGLASLLAVFFGETAVTFDQAPFRNSASISVASDLVSYLSDPARGYSTQDLQGLTNFISAAANGGIPNEGNVLDFSVQGEILSAASALRIGSQTSLTHSPDNWFGSSVDLHSQALLTAFLQSDQTAPAQHSFRDVTLKLTDLLKMIFDSNLFEHTTAISNTTDENFIERLVRHENGIAENAITGETAIVADAMLTRFTSDLWKIAQDGGLTLHDGNSSTPDLHELSKALIAFAMQKYYEETTTSAGYNKALFTDHSTANEGSNGIRFDMADVSKDFALTLAQSGKGGELSQVNGYQDFLYYLNQTDNGLNADERQLIKSLLPYMRDWYVQAGASGMIATDTLNRGAFMLGGTGGDALVGGTAADLLVGNKGDDLLQGGKGNDILLGGKGNDSYVYTSGDGFDTIFDYDGTGSIAYDGSILAGGAQYGDDKVHRDANKHLYVDIGKGRMVIDGNILIEDQQAGELGLTMAGPAAITTPQYTNLGTDGDDDIHINLSDVAEDVIDTGAGQDFVFTSYGNDIIIGGAGSDALDGFAGDDRLYADSIVSVADAIALGNTQAGTGLLGDALSGDGGNDTLIGGAGNDILSGGADADLLVSGAGNDYIFGDTDWAAGNGRDWGVVNNVLVGGAGGIALWTGNTSDVIYAGAGDDRVWGELGNDVIFGEKGVDVLTGGDGNDVILGGDDNDSILGDYDNIAAAPGNDYLDGGAGDDIIDGNEGGDIIIGGAGADTLYGGAGKDTYIFNRGDGGDTVYDTRADNNIFRFGAGISSSDITLRLGSLMLDLGNGDAIHIAGFDQNDVSNSSSIGSFEFADGSTLTATELLARGFDLDGTVDSDTINGTNTTDRINGLGGNDLLFGMAGSDTLNGGDGNDQLVGDDGTVAFSGNDLINGDAGDDYIWGNGGDDTLNGGTGNDTLQGETGNDSLIGGDGNDQLAGGAGNDTLSGGEGDDIYFYNLGEGIDHITDSGGTDRLVLGNGATIANLRLDVGSLKMVFSDGSELHLDDFDPANPLAGSIELIQFSDGQEYTREQMIQTLGFNIQGGSGDSVLSGTALGETITTYAGNDTVTALGGNDTVNGGAGNDTLYGDAGADNLLGGLGDDLLAGGADNDTLDGGGGNDTYLFGRGAGQDIVYDDDTTVGNLDKIQIAADVLPGDVTVSKNGVNLNLSISNPDGTTDKLTLANWYSGDAYKVEQVVFSDGTVWDVPMLDALTKAATQGDDIIDGSSGNDVLNGLGGNDTLRGYAGDDTLDGGTGDDRLYGGDGNDLLRGGAGSDLLQGDAGNDTLDGGVGDDSLYGNEGNDTYLFGRDSGQDIVQYYLTATDNADKVQIAAGLSPADVIVTRDQDHLFLSINNPDGTTAKLTLANWFGNGVSKVGEVAFADGTVWDEQALKAMMGVPTEGADIISGTSGDDVINGLGGDDTLYGNAGNDTLNGGAGVDTMLGGQDNDTYIVDVTADVVTENANEGTDTVQSSATYTLGANIENLTLTGVAAINGTGNSLNNTLTGNSAANVLAGGAGDDTYVIGTGDTVIENASEGIDTIQADATYTLGANIENLTLTGGVAINGTGNALNNILTGSSAVNVLTGGLGNDTYVINIGDSVIENTNEGIDTVQANLTYTLGANLENLTLTGISSINGTGNASNNILIGNSASNTLDGQVGADTLIGGAGNDTYVVDNSADVITENANEGTDAVQSSATYTLSANIESLTLTGTTAINGTGNSQNNTLTGNSGANVLSGGSGDDTYVIQAGDTVVENANEGVDSVQSALTYTLVGTNVENLTLAGTATINGTGNTSNNIIIGNAAKNTLTGGAGDDVLDGGAGVDTMVGGIGNDYYVIENTRDAITENANEGIDTVQTSFTFTLGVNFENLVLAPNVLINGTGNASNNIITGNALDNILDGAAGADTFIGGAGNDTYIVDNSADVITENVNEGTDAVQSSVSYTLSANIESLTLTGTAAINGTGNSSSNTLTGNSATNVLSGGAGDDTYVIGAGDTVVENANEGVDTVQSSVTFTLGANVENLTLTGASVINGTGNNLANTLAGDGNTKANVLTGGLGDDTYILGAGDTAVENANEGIDTVLSSVAFTLGVNLENLTLTGTSAINGTGNTLNNVLTGNSAANVLSGGAGDDTYFVGAGDTVVENLNQGVDTVQSSASFTIGTNIENLVLTGSTALTGTGNALNNVITGNAQNNVLDGGAGADTMTGGLGDDTYVVDNAADIVVEYAGGGNDTVQSYISFISGGNVENVTLLGTAAINATGDDSNNVLTGNSAANTLIGGAGDDTLNGGGGADILMGGLGNDIYVAISGVTIIENANEGTDTLQSTVTATLSDNNVENLTLTGTAAINGTGNSLNNVITGNAGNNILDGGAGTDTIYGGDGNDTLYGVKGEALYGGNGDDTYIFTGTDSLSISDVYLFESWAPGGGSGIDTIMSNGSVSLATGNQAWPQDIENITLTGTGNTSAKGNGLNNVLTGNSGNNFLYCGNLNSSANVTLIGGAGDDSLYGSDYGGTVTMIGGVGNDYYTIFGADVVTITENLNEGTDTVDYSHGTSYTLAANVENLVVWGATGIGNALNNVITSKSSLASTLYGMAGDDTLVGNLNLTGDTLAGGTGNDTYVMGTGDVITENLNEGIDTVQSFFTYTLGANLENLTLTGTAAINGTGNTLNNVINDNSTNNLLNGGQGNDTVNGGAGNDVLEGADGNDTLSDTAGNNLFNGGAGTDILTGSVGNELFIGGAGNDTITTGTGADIIAFNKGDGQDTVVASTGADNTLSLGGGINYANLAMSKSGNDLILATGNSDQITLQNWYSGTTNHSIANLQLVLDAGNYNAGSADPLLNQQVQGFNFAALAQAFDQALAANPTLTSWSMTNALLNAHLSGSNTAALGGDLAYQYNLNGSLAGIGLASAQTVINDASFGVSPQQLQPLANLQVGAARLG